MNLFLINVFMKFLVCRLNLNFFCCFCKWVSKMLLILVWFVLFVVNEVLMVILLGVKIFFFGEEESCFLVFFRFV